MGYLCMDEMGKVLSADFVLLHNLTSIRVNQFCAVLSDLVL